MPILPVFLVSVSRMTRSASPVASDWAPLFPQNTDVCVAPLSTPTARMSWSARESPQGSRTRHTICTEVIRDAFMTVQIPVLIEPTGLLCDDGRRPDGTTLTPWQRGKTIACEFTCVNRLATSDISSGNKKAQ